MRNKTYFSFLPTQPIDSFIEFVTNQLLSMDPDITSKLAPLDGSLIRLEFKDELLFFLRVQNGQVGILPDAAGPPDVTVRMSTFPTQRLKVSSRSIFWSRLVEDIDGDTDIVIEVEQFLSNFQPDWEEGMSKFVGDCFTHNIFWGASMIKGWQDNAKSELIKNISDYFQRESTLLLTREQTEKHFSRVNQLAEDVLKLEMRLLSHNYL